MSEQIFRRNESSSAFTDENGIGMGRQNMTNLEDAEK